MINGSHSGQCPLIWNLLSSFQMSEHRPSFEKFINHYRFTIFFLSFFFRYSVTITENCYDWGTAYSKPWLERVRDATWLVKWLSSSATCPEMPRWPCGTESMRPISHLTYSDLHCKVFRSPSTLTSLLCWPVAKRAVIRCKSILQNID